MTGILHEDTAYFSLIFDYECLLVVSFPPPFFLHGILPKNCALTVKAGGGLKHVGLWGLTGLTIIHLPFNSS